MTPAEMSYPPLPTRLGMQILSQNHILPAFALLLMILILISIKIKDIRSWPAKTSTASMDKSSRASFVVRLTSYKCWSLKVSTACPEQIMST